MIRYILLFQVVYIMVSCCESCEDQENDLWEREAYNDNDANFNPGFSLKKFRREQLELHNHYRRLHGVPMMRIDRSLNKQAQWYAEKLAADNKGMHHCKMPKCNRYGAGENLATAWGGTTVEANATKWWYDEIWDYDFCSGGNRPGHEGKQIGHFTQVVWKTSTKLGIGYARTNDRKRVYVVGRYQQHGNYRGKYPENVLKPSYILSTYQDNCNKANGRYTAWSRPGRCTQSCGGGIRLKTRTCSNPKPSFNGKDCSGATKEIFVKKWCKIKTCTNKVKHRDQQCRARGYQTSGYLRRAECTLYCLSDKQYTTMGKVDDGTHCKSGSGVCVDGKCISMPKYIVKTAPGLVSGGATSGKYTDIPNANHWKNRFLEIPNGAVNVLITNNNYKNVEIMVGWTKGMGMGVDFSEAPWMNSFVEFKGMYSQAVTVKGVTLQYKRLRDKSTFEIKGPVYAQKGYKIQLFLRGKKRGDISWSFSTKVGAK